MVGLTACLLSVGFLRGGFRIKVAENLLLMSKFLRSKDNNEVAENLLLMSKFLRNKDNNEVAENLLLMSKFLRNKDNNGEWSPCILLCLTKACLVDLWLVGGVIGLSSLLEVGASIRGRLSWVPSGRGGDGSVVIAMRFEGGVEVLVWVPSGAVLLWVPSGRGGEGSAVIARRLEGGVEVGWSWFGGLGGVEAVRQ